MVPIESCVFFLGCVQFSSKSDRWVQRYHHFCEKNPEISYSPFVASFARSGCRKDCSSIRESMLSLYKPCNSFLGGACSRQGAEPPAGPQNFDLLFESDHFFKKNVKILSISHFLVPENLGSQNFPGNNNGTNRKLCIFSGLCTSLIKI